MTESNAAHHRTGNCESLKSGPGTFHFVHSPHPCTELILDNGKIRGYLEAAGMREAAGPGDADIVLVTTCAFNSDYEKAAVADIETVRGKLRPGSRLVVTGCLPKINPELFESLGVTDSISPSELNRIEAIVPSRTGINEISAHTASIREYEGNRVFMAGIRLKRLFLSVGKLFSAEDAVTPRWLESVPMPDWHFIRASSGCLGVCSYCAIKRSRGSVRSEAPLVVADQVRQAVALGKKNIALAGDDLGCWGQDIGSSLPELLNEILKIPGDYSISIRFIEPMWLIRYLPDLYPFFKTGRIRSFCVPLQSGSQRILDLMARNYQIGEAVDAINYVLSHTAVRSISSIVMVGFPGETARDFSQTCDLLGKCSADLYQVLEYQGRPGTPSEKLPDKVSDETKRSRKRYFSILMKLSKFLKLPFRAVRNCIRFPS